MNTTTGKRIEFIDGVRGIAALLVMLSHLGVAYMGDRWYVIEGKYINYGRTGVVAFFLVSGFIIPFSLEKVSSVGKFWVGRVFRIYPLYLFVLMIGLILGLSGFGFWAHLLHGNIAKMVIFNILLIQEYVNSPVLVENSWTLSIEMIWYIFFSALFSLKLQNRLNYIWFFAFSLIVLSIIISIFTKHRLPFGRIGMFVCCISGYYFYLNTKGSISNKKAVFFIGSLFFIILLGLFISEKLGDKRYSFANNLWSWGSAYAIFILFFMTRSLKSHLDSVFVYLGSISYSVYLVHGLLLGIFANYLNFTIWVLIAVPISSIVVSTLTYKYIEKPGIQLGKKLSRILFSRLPTNKANEGVC